MTDEEEQIAFEQYVKDWGDQYGAVSKTVLW